MGTRAFIWVVVIVLALSVGVGGVLYAVAGGDDEPAVARTATGDQAPGAGTQLGGAGAAGGDSGDALTPGTDATSAQPDDAAPDAAELGGEGRAFGDLFGGGGLPFEIIAGTVASVDASGVVLATTDGTLAIEIPADTPVRESKTAAEAGGDLTPGTEITAVLSRTSDGTIVATNITVGAADGFGFGGFGGFGGRRGGRLGGRQGGGDGGGDGLSGGDRQGGRRGDGSGARGDFNAVTGTVDSFADGKLVLNTPDGTVEVIVANDTSVRVTQAFADASAGVGPDTELTVVGSRTEDGTFQPTTVVVGTLGLGGGGFGGFGRFPGGDGFDFESFDFDNFDLEAFLNSQRDGGG